MKRTAFIRNAGLLGAGIVLAPIGFATAKNAKHYQLPKAVQHVPHGNFAATEAERVHVPEMNMDVSVEHFMRNGIEACDQDVSVYTFSRKNEVLKACFADGEWTTAGRLTGVQHRQSSERFLIGCAPFELQLTPDSSILKLVLR